MIPYKLFMRLQDLQAKACEARVSRASGKGGIKEEAELISFEEEIGWPWRASQAQIKEWIEWMQNSGMLG